MEYAGSLPPRNVDEKQCIFWPEEWPYDEQGFVFVQGKKDIKIYPYVAWRTAMKKKGKKLKKKKSKKKEEKKIAWFENASPRAYLDDQKRLLLPQYFANWKRVALIGKNDYVIICEPTE
ncbi:MAG: hypothetical protein WCL18_06395 [bacterium]